MTHSQNSGTASQTPGAWNVDYEPTTILRTPAPWNPVLWDMDGTLLDSHKAIVRRLSETMVHFGVEPLDSEHMKLLIGPPVGSSLSHFVRPTQLDEARAYYRSLAQRDGLKDQHLFEWIPETLNTLHRAGISMAVATSKPQHEAERICEEFRINKYFDAIVGADDSRTDKASVISQCLIQLSQPDMNPVMIGDRYFDTEGALVNNIPTILVRWGYADAQEYEGAMASVSGPEELLALLLKAPH